MGLGFAFFFNSMLFGIGLSMDAFSVSLANGLNEPCMKKSKTLSISGTFAFFQFIMPLIGWICVHTIVQFFSGFEKLIPWIALGLLGFIGGKMLLDGIKNNSESCESGLGFGALMLQGLATSIDALSVGFTIAHYNFFEAFAECLIIAAVTFSLCLLGLSIGKRAGTKLSGKAGILGGTILIFIGLEIFLTSFF
ncbi:MAG: manganese efflux pump [Ruminococcaceae bacterium]|nr:manganese efflux pump [Oscillospiraceae bacterium]